MRWSHLKRLSDGRLVVHFPRCKGGKQMDDLLPTMASTAILTWLGRCYGDLERVRPDAPVWVCLSRRDEGKPLTTRGMSQVCQKYLGTSKVHVTRHTFARTMEDAGAKVSEISMRLAQDNPAVVGRYLARLRREDNQYADSLVSLYGFKANGQSEE